MPQSGHHRCLINPIMSPKSQQIGQFYPASVVSRLESSEPIYGPVEIWDKSVQEDETLILTGQQTSASNARNNMAFTGIIVHTVSITRRAI